MPIYYPTRNTEQFYKMIETAWPTCCLESRRILDRYVVNIRKQIPGLSEANAREIVAVIAEWIYCTQPRGIK